MSATTGTWPDLCSAAALTGQAGSAGLTVLAAAGWPESAADQAPPPIAGFVVSSFSPLAAEVARRCLLRRPVAPTVGTDSTDGSTVEAAGTVTAVVVVSPLGDLAGAVHVAETTDAGGRVGPLLFFQAVPNAVAGHVAALWQLTGPVVCVGDTRAGLAVAALLLDDGDADLVLLVRVDQAAAPGTRDRAGAVLLRADASSGAGPHTSEREQP